jgi:hypothetical protein
MIKNPLSKLLGNMHLIDRHRLASPAKSRS